ncbi:hypothetical protein [Pantoea sp. SS70]|uniref:hypothetical protein n=1 Tax=Pantoea sp. SS70 TaxID=3024247 RepID=UPI0024531F52|nr:hypothetical protein [Pantoea sp. SS70]WGK59971.1 hypothetical protein PO881_23675 [Pantoea sp. SS70]
MLNLTEQHAADRLADDVADIDETLSELFLRIHAMRQRWPRDSDVPAVRLTLLAVDDICDSLRDAGRRAEQLRGCLRR